MATRKFGTVRPTGKNSGLWTARYSKAGKKYSSLEPFVKESLAWSWLEKERALIRDGDWTPPKERFQKKQVDLLTVGEWVDQFNDLKEGEGIRPSTMRTYRNTTKNRISNHPIADVALVDLDQSAVQSWWDDMTAMYLPGKGRETSRKGYVRLKAACEEAVHRKMIPANPVNVRSASRKGESKDKELPERAELQAIVDNVSENYRFAAVMCAFHGVRVGEVLALRVQDVHVTGESAEIWIRGNVQRVMVDGKTTMVRQDAKTKAGRREVPVFPDFVPLVKKQLAEAKASGCELLTTTSKGKVVMDTSFRSVWERARDKGVYKTKTGGMKPVSSEITPHYGRNWLITELAEAGATPAEIGRILGQTDLKTIVETYMRVKANRPADLMAKISQKEEK